MAEGLEVNQQNQKYMILLILTDGIINDMEKTIDQIVRGSALPLSIIIVGVGDADFSSMDVLDADDEPLYSRKFKKYMASDIVQFVPFSEFKNDARLLAKETLEEVPRQFLSFMERNNILPNNAANEVAKDKIKKSLSLRSRQNEMDQKKEADEYFGKLREQFIQRVVAMGCGHAEAKQFIEERGVPENDPALLVSGVNAKHRFRNPLFEKQIERSRAANSMPGDLSYDYFNPGNNAQFSEAPQGGRPLAPLNNGGMAHINQAQHQASMVQNDDDGASACAVCLNKKIQTVCIPCGHRCLCLDCSKVVNTECPICRNKIQQIMQTFDA